MLILIVFTLRIPRAPSRLLAAYWKQGKTLFIQFRERRWREQERRNFWQRGDEKCEQFQSDEVAAYHQHSIAQHRQQQQWREETERRKLGEEGREKKKKFVLFFFWYPTQKLLKRVHDDEERGEEGNEKHFRFHIRNSNHFAHVCLLQSICYKWIFLISYQLSINFQ